MTKSEVKALEKYPIEDGKMWTSAFGTFEFDRNYPERKAFQEGYEEAEKDMLSKFTKEHLEGLKWTERSGITSQPIPYHKYCEDLCKILEELLNR